MTGPTPPAAADLLVEYLRVRAATVALAAPLSDEDCCVQSMPDASPVKWHLAHTTWFFETFVLEPQEPGFRVFDPAFRVLFNSYYNGIGERHPRPRRGLLTRPARGAIERYRQHVDDRMAKFLAARGEEPVIAGLVTLGLAHEEQHQELILTDVKHLLAQSPLRPAYASTPVKREDAPAPVPGAAEWITFDGGIRTVGHDGRGFAFDNEAPRHEVLLRSHALGSRLVTNAEFLRFVEAGGYREPSHWLSEGWDWVCANSVGRPTYWIDEDGERSEFSLRGTIPLDPDRPVSHLSYFEADAYARWAGARLPTEAEWENAASSVPVAGHFADRGRFHPAAAGGPGLAQIYGDLWEWTQSAYLPYPGYRPAAGAIGEYNGKFMINQMVLRGGSCATPAGHVRPTYRNFFPAHARWQFSGLRLARDAG